MSFRLVCHETRQYVWVGQGWGQMTTFYSGVPETMARLGRFLAATRGQPLYLLCVEEDDSSLFYEEFEAPDDDDG